jgi:osmotically-inducible protein OsmY
MLCALTGALIHLSGCGLIAVGGVAATGLVMEDRRTPGIYLEDEGIEWKTSSRLAEHFRESVHVNATSYNRQVLLTGEVPDAAARAEAERIAAGVPNVRRVINELTIGGVSSLASRGADAAITTQVKSRFVGNEKFSAIHVKVTTEASVVYLMGLVTREEAEAAVEVARTTRGVARVVKVFEYVTVERKPPSGEKASARGASVATAGPRHL